MIMNLYNVWAQVGEVAQEHKWAVLQGWLRRQAPTPLLVVFENAEDSVHLEVGAAGGTGSLIGWWWHTRYCLVCSSILDQTKLGVGAFAANFMLSCARGQQQQLQQWHALHAARPYGVHC
jgi:hypothetical protein